MSPASPGTRRRDAPNMPPPVHQPIIDHYAACYGRHGDSHAGADWPNAVDVETRYRVMLELAPRWTDGLSLLDLGCGTAELYAYLRRHVAASVAYTGVDLVPAVIARAREKYPKNRYACLDVLREAEALGAFDYIVANGVFTEKCSLEHDAMRDYFQRLVRTLFFMCDRGIAFNVMSSHVDWQRDDLFHLPLDDLAAFLIRGLTRNFVIRNDYGLYEYTVYVYR